MMIVDWILSVFGLVGVFAASLFDIKTKEVPDWISFSLIFLGLGTRLIYSLVYNQWMFLVYGLVGLVAMFVVSNVLYYTKQWGGGDAKLLIGLGALFGTTPYFVKTSYPFLFVFLVNLFIIGAFYGLGWSVFFYFKNFVKVNIYFFKLMEKAKTRIYLYLGLALMLGFLFIISEQGLFRLLMIILALFFLFYPPLFYWVKAVEKVGFIRSVPVSKLSLGDWLARDVKSKGKVLISAKVTAVSEKHIRLLKKHHIKKVWVKDGVAFVPSFFIALVFTLVYGLLIKGI